MIVKITEISGGEFKCEKYDKISIDSNIDYFAFDESDEKPEPITKSFESLLKEFGYVFYIDNNTLILDLKNTYGYFNNGVFISKFREQVTEIIQPFLREIIINELI